MRIKNVTVVVLPCIILWGLFTYYLFATRVKNTPAVPENMQHLENIIKSNFVNNWRLIQDLKSILKPTKDSEQADKPGDISVQGLEAPRTAVEVSKSPAYNFQVKIDGFKGPIIPVIVFACNRVSVEKCINQLLKHRPSKEQFPIIVSQDCDHEATRKVILSYKDEVTLIQQPDQSDIIVQPIEKKFKGYFKIARHYFWALNQTFLTFGFETAIIVEDDLDIAADFFEYFLGTYPILKKDKTLWCVSAWNDNGKIGLVDEHSPELLYRTDFFSGLGWMLTKDVWNELAPKWPRAYWDDWIRQPQQRKERACIRPELSRTHTFGKIGVSNGLFFEKHLKYIKLNEQYIPFTTHNLSYLLKDNYDSMFVQEVYNSAIVSYQELRTNNIAGPGPVRIPYYTKDAYKKTAKMLGLMDDFRSGVPRMAYRGVISFFYKGRRVYLAPHANWKGYDVSWS